jgi:hypothetical protein
MPRNQDTKNPAAIKSAARWLWTVRRIKIVVVREIDEGERGERETT